MREEIKDKGRIVHIIEAIENVFNFLENKTLDDLQNDKILFFAVVKNVEIIGEAAYKLTPAFIESFPNIPWKQIIRMRHILVHGYYHIEPFQLFNVYKEDLPFLLPLFKSMIP